VAKRKAAPPRELARAVPPKAARGVGVRGGRAGGGRAVVVDARGDGAGGGRASGAGAGGDDSDSDECD